MTFYKITNDHETHTFYSEKEACEYLGVAQCSVASAFRRNYRCKGFRIEKIGDSFHRETKTRLHKIWSSMIERCEYQKHVHYNRYGGRGIEVCDDWHDYLKFREWAVNNGYNESLTIDRIDYDGNYNPTNCRWASQKTQHNNKNSNRNLTVNGETHTIAEWSDITGINRTTIKERLNMGWTEKDCIETPVRPRKRGRRPSAEYKDERVLKCPQNEKLIGM